LDFYRARVVDGLGHVIHERLFAIELADDGSAQLRDASLIGDLVPAPAPPDPLPSVVGVPEASHALNDLALAPFLEEVKSERVAGLDRVAAHIELSLTELLNRVDLEIGKANEDKENGVPGADGRLAQAENRHAELWARRDRRREELARQKALTLQGVERLT